MTSRVSNPWWQGGDDDDLKRNPYAEEDDDISSTGSPVYIEDGAADRYEADRRTALEAELPDHSSRQRYTQLLRDQQSTTATATTTTLPKRDDVLGAVEFGRTPTDPVRVKDFARTRSSEPVRVTRSSWSGRIGNERERVSSSNHHPTTRKSYPEADRPRTSPPAPSRTSSSSSNKKYKKTFKWSCKSCTYYNEREFTITASEPSVTAMCEVCFTPHRFRVDFKSDRRRSSRNEKGASGPKSTPRTEIQKIEKPRMGSRKTSTGENTLSTSSSGSSSKDNNNNGNTDGKTSYSMSELIKHLGTNENSTMDLPPALEGRVQDFRFAQKKRLEKHGDQKPWGIYGLYAHLSDIRADLEWAEDAAWRRDRGKPYLSWKDFDNARDEGLHNRPIFTYSLLALCTLMLIVTIGVNGGFEPLTVNPLIGPSSETLLRCGARDTNLIVNENQWFRLFTPIVLHAGLVHYLVNMLALYFIGGAVEKAHGWHSAAVFFIIPAVGGNILSAICLPGFISVGASGGIFGLIGGCMADICLNWNLLFLKTTTDDDARSRHFYVLLWLAMDIIINCLLGFTPFVDNFTHLGGFLYGFCIGFASIERLASSFFGMRAGEEGKLYRLAEVCLRFFGLIVSVIAIMVTTVVLINSDGVTSPCPGCRYISCVPFPPNADEKWWYCDDCDIVTADIYRAIDGTGLYEQVDINCPNGEIEQIPIDEELIYDQEELRRLLPSLCRSNCDEVFGTTQSYRF